MSVYRVTEIIGTSKTSWEDAAKQALIAPHGYRRTRPRILGEPTQF